MIRLFLLLLFLFTTPILFGQTEAYTVVITDFESKYNAEEYASIFNGFSPEMKLALPLDQAKQFLNGLQNQYGKIESTTFVGYEQGSYATYKTTFEKGILGLHFSLDGGNKINGLFLKPYIESNAEAIPAVNALNSYPKVIAEQLYSKTKSFPNGTQLSVAVIKNGKTNYYGIIRSQDSIKPIDNQNSVFEIGSLTKVFTASVFASLVVDKKIKLTDDVNAYYPFVFKDGIKIRFESLANHTSGLPRLPENLDLSNTANPYKSYGKKELELYLETMMQLEQVTGTSYSYSNLGAGLLGYTLGLSQKTSFEVLLQKRIFDKYKMKHSYTTSKGLGGELIKGLSADGTTVSNWDFGVLFGGGGILSTTADLAKFAAAQFDTKNKVSALMKIPTFTINEKMKIGLGWHLLPSKNGKEMLWHNGGTGGYSSSMAVDVDNESAVIILSNVSGLHPEMANIDGLCFGLIGAE
jgi:CubicO group peptidase (beta-lactamase class C family)